MKQLKIVFKAQNNHQWPYFNQATSKWCNLTGNAANFCLVFDLHEKRNLIWSIVLFHQYFLGIVRAHISWGFSLEKWNIVQDVEKATLRYKLVDFPVVMRENFFFVCLKPRNVGAGASHLLTSKERTALVGNPCGVATYIINI